MTSNPETAMSARILVGLATTRPASPEPAESRNCERCCGNGELVSDWETYLHPPEGAPGDAGTIDCPDCDGRGTVESDDAPDQIADHANCSVGEELVERVSRALHHSERGPVKSDEWRLYVPAARAALAAMPTSEAIRADERGRVVAIMRDVIRSFQECDGYELAGQMRIRLDRLTGGGE